MTGDASKPSFQRPTLVELCWITNHLMGLPFQEGFIYFLVLFISCIFEITDCFLYHILYVTVMYLSLLNDALSLP